MASVGFYRYRTLPAGLMAHHAQTIEGRELLRGMGHAAATLQPVMGNDVGSFVTIMAHASVADWASATEAVFANPAWMEFYAKAAATGAAEEVEASLFTDMDPDFKAEPMQGVGAISATQWLPTPGKAALLMEHIHASLPHIVRLGGAPRVMQCTDGAHAMSILVSVRFASLAALGAHRDALARDPQWIAYWTGAMANPSAHLVRNGVYVMMP